MNHEIGKCCSVCKVLLSLPYNQPTMKHRGVALVNGIPHVQELEFCKYCTERVKNGNVFGLEYLKENYDV